MSTVSLLASVIGGQEIVWPVDGPTESEFLEAASFHGVGPLVARGLGARPHDGPSWLRRVASREAARTAAYTLFREHELIDLLDDLAARGVHPVLIKGIALAYAHYQEPHLRPGFDIDLMIERDAVREVSLAFEKRGYRRSHQVSGDLVMPQLDYEKRDQRGVWHIYDVHWKLAAPQAFAQLLTYCELWPEAAPIPRLGPHARRPSDVHSLFIACVHRVAHHPGDGRLIWLYDVHLLAEHLGVAGLERFAALAKEKGVSGICAGTLAEARRLFGTRVPDGLAEDLAAHSSRVGESSRVFMDGHSRFDILLSDLRLVDGWSKRFRLLGEHAFPPRAYMFALYGTRSTALLPALYLHRAAAGAWKWLAEHRNAARSTTAAPAVPRIQTAAPIPLAKRGLDVTLSALGLAASLPVWVSIAAAIKLEDGGPVFYSQARVGEGGRLFPVFKFRSMIPNAEAGVGAIQSGENDPRITRVGRLLRATALDELPQLWNILRGDMSFVGPRALRPSEIETTSEGELVPLERIAGYVERSRLRPGLTGIAQIYAPRDVTRRHKFRFDRIYSRRQGFWLDVRLILLSFWITFRGRWEHRSEKI